MSGTFRMIRENERIRTREDENLLKEKKKENDNRTCFTRFYAVGRAW